MAKKQASLRDQLELVEQRLAETLQVFAAYSTINQLANKETNAALNAIVNQRGGFWHATAISSQTHLFTGIYALVELDHKVVTLATIAGRINNDNPSGVPAELVGTLDHVRKRYERCRHVLFGHNGKDREALVARFDEYGFSWDSIQVDLACLEHAFKSLWLLADGKPAPSLEVSNRMRFPYAAVIDRTVADTIHLLNDLQKPE